MNDGSIQWETTIAPAHGKTELERLDDIDGSVRVAGADVYAVGFQGRVAMLALDTGQIWWSHDASSYRSLGLDDEALYLATAEGDVVALRRRTGTEIWRQKALAHRRLSAAVESEDAIVTADFQGYVHWLDKATGAIAARASSGKVRVSNPPLVVGNMVLVMNDAGRITAFRTARIPGAHPAAATAAEKPAGQPPDKPSTQPIPAKIGEPEPSVPSAPTATPAGSAADVSPPAADTSSVPASPSPPRTPSPQPTASPEPPPTPQTAPTPPLPPGSRQPPLPSQQTPDPLPPQPQTQPQPPPN